MSACSAIYINLPVADPGRSRSFFEGLGFAINPQFSDANATCVVLGDNMYAMLLARDFFAGFCTRPVGDPAASTAVLTCLHLGARDEVDAMVARASSSGGASHREPADHGWMYQSAFRDPDGNVWELMATTGDPPWG
ncbi:VOC family protein [Luteimonas sp. MC1825]|uniref:VOC family protein n=1 Tax=Luteimonas sp. MC1825 TaxID=2761107 RepID=UPI0016152D5F|nr:VOC family protein [Luteimonas sp. MC1825]MBB6598264.1 VOC family protein [Luteimonas sp. MC1825]QOC88478.1 VOC family protein [Luteimonas sp. MC1825]